MYSLKGMPGEIASFSVHTVFPMFWSNVTLSQCVIAHEVPVKVSQDISCRFVMEHATTKYGSET